MTSLTISTLLAPLAKTALRSTVYQTVSAGGELLVKRKEIREINKPSRWEKLTERISVRCISMWLI
jgi:hypothetical protein